MTRMSAYAIRWDRHGHAWRLEDIDGPLADEHGRLYGWADGDYAGAAAARDCLDRGLPIPPDGLLLG